jgi:hypothetical protein
MINKIRKYLNIIEGVRNSIIVVDVQPMYKKYIDFNISDFVEHIQTFDKILFFYVGSENSGIGTDTEEDIMQWLVSEYEFPEERLGNITFIDKGYAFFREYMDSTSLDDDDIIKIVKYLIEYDLHDTRDVEDPKVRKDLGLPEDIEECIYLPGEFDITDIRGFENSELVGGGADECLREIELYLQAYNFPYHKNYRFIY